MLSAYYMTALGALVWLLMRRSVDRCEERADPRLICYLTRNSEEFLAHFTLVAAAFALVSIVILIGIGSGISTAASLSPIEALLIQAQRWLEAAGLSVWSTSAILIGVYLIHLIRLPEDLEFPHFPPALRFIRKPTRGIRAVLHTGVYLVVLIAASTAFFASQADSLTEIVSARLSETPRVASPNRDRIEEQVAAGVANVEVVVKHIPRDPIEQPLEEIPTPESPGGERMEDRQPVGQAEEAEDRTTENRQRLTAFRAEALESLKGVRLTRGEATGSSKPGRTIPSVPVNPYVQSQGYRGGYLPGQRQPTPYPHPGYYHQGYWRGAPVARQGIQPGYPGSRAYPPQKQAASGKVDKGSLDAEKLIEAVHSDLDGLGDPEQQARAIAAAVELFDQFASTDPKFFDKVERFAREFLPADGATASLVSRHKAPVSRPASASASAVSSPYRPARPPVLLYPRQVPAQRAGVSRPE